MPDSPLRLGKSWLEHHPKREVDALPSRLRGIYVLYKHDRRTGAYKVVYIGMPAAGEVLLNM